MHNTIINKMVENKQIFKNVSYLSLIQVFTLFFPIITYPYLIKVLGLSIYGKVIFYQTSISYIGILINYGFNISGVKALSNEKKEYSDSEIVSSIYLIKLLIATIISILIIIFSLSNIINFDNLLFICSLSLIFNELLFPQWYFQAKEKLKTVTILVFFVRVISLSLMFIFINNEKDYYLVPLLSGIGYFIIGVISILILKRNHINIVIPKLKLIINLFNESTHYFLTSAIISIKNKVDILIVGMFISKEMVVVYDLALKIHNMSLMPINIINNAIFARMSRERNKELLISAIKNSFLISIIGVILVILLSPYAAEFMSHGKNTDLVISLIYILVISLPFFAVGLTLAQNGIVVFGYSKYHLFGMISTTLFYLIGLSFIFLFGFEKNIFSYAILTVSVYFYEMVYRFILCKKLDLI